MPGNIEGLRRKVTQRIDSIYQSLESVRESYYGYTSAFGQIGGLSRPPSLKETDYTVYNNITTGPTNSPINFRVSAKFRTHRSEGQLWVDEEQYVHVTIDPSKADNPEDYSSGNFIRGRNFFIVSAYIRFPEKKARLPLRHHCMSAFVSLLIIATEKRLKTYDEEHRVCTVKDDYGYVVISWT